MKKNGSLKIIAIILLCCAGFLKAETFGGSAVMFLNEEPSVRCFGMSGLCSVFINDAAAAYSNPGLLGHMTESAVSASMWKSADGMGQYSFLNAVVSGGAYGSFNLGFFGYSSGKESFYDISGNNYNLELAKDYAFSGGWGLPFDEHFFWGVKFKRVSSTLAEKYSANTMTFDSGLVYKSLNDVFSAGAVVENFAGQLSYKYEDEKMPSLLKADTGIKLSSRKLNFYFGIAAKKGLREKFIEKSLGSEIELKDLPLAIRAGIKQSYDGLASNMGFSFKISSFRLDYGTEFPDRFSVGNHRFAVSYNFSLQTDRERAQVYEKRYLKEKAYLLYIRDVRNNEKSFVIDRKKQEKQAKEETLKPKSTEKPKQENPKKVAPEKEKKEEKRNIPSKEADWFLLP